MAALDQQLPDYFITSMARALNICHAPVQGTYKMRKYENAKVVMYRLRKSKKRKLVRKCV